jgi:iron-sulfur cluster repair protein YtfE (RIC family)
MTEPAKRALTELLAQHDTLRQLIARCTGLADEIDAGRGSPSELMREISRLRIAFDAHNKFEEHLLRPILRDVDAFGAVRVDQMVEDHTNEHRLMRERLNTSITGELRAVLESLRAHLETEERYFLSSRVLRDDLITVEGGG